MSYMSSAKKGSVESAFAPTNAQNLVPAPRTTLSMLSGSFYQLVQTASPLGFVIGCLRPSPAVAVTIDHSQTPRSWQRQFVAHPP